MRWRASPLTGPEPETPSGEVRPVVSLIRRPPVTCEPDTPVAIAAETMAVERVSSILIPHADGVGILTDRDLRAKVVSARASLDAPVSAFMSSPASTVPGETPVAEVLLRMLEGGFHHFPVTDEGGRIVGVVTDTDLMGIGRHSPFALKSAIDRASSRDAIVDTARGLPDMVVSLVEASADPVDVGLVVALTIDALTRRLLELGIERYGAPPVPWAWLALGSAARQEQAIHTDQDHALAFDPEGRPVEEIDPYFAELTRFVTDGLEAAGIQRCQGDAMASNSALRRSVEGWAETFRQLMVEPGRLGSIILSIVFDYRRVAGPLDVEPALDAVISTAQNNRDFIRHLAHRALDDRPPTRFFREFVVSHKGEYEGRLDIKHGGITTIGNIARAWAIGAGLIEKRTIARLRAGAAAGAYPDPEEAAMLEEAFRFLWQVRLEHHAACLDAGLPVDDFLDPNTLGPMNRKALKEAFRIIARAQKTLATEFGSSP